MVSGAHRSGDRLVEDLVLARLDRAPGPAEEDALATHLRDCRECAAFARQQERLHAALRTIAAPARVDAAERERIWAEIASRRRASQVRWPRILGRLAFAAAVLLVAAIAGFLLVQGRPAAAPPVREVVATSTFELPGGTATLAVLQGSAFARQGARIGVGVETEIVLNEPAKTGRAEIRFRPQGDSSYGVLGAAPDLAGSTRATVGGAVPRPAGPEPVIYEVWLHLELDAGTIDSQPLIVEVTPIRDGEQARPR